MTAGKQLYGQLEQAVEPVFGIINEALHFRRFLLRGQEEIDLKRFLNLGMKLQKA